MQLLELGIGARRDRSRLRRGTLHLVHRGVYAVGHRGLTVRVVGWRRCSLRPEAVLSHARPARLGAAAASSIATEVDKAVQSFVGGLASGCTESSLPDDESTVVDGIPVTSVPRTIFDIAAGLSEGGSSGPLMRPKCGG